MNDKRLTSGLQRLARLYGVQTAYYGVHHRRKEASAESLLGALKALGAPVASLKDVPAALRERKQALWHKIIEPVTVAWDGKPPDITVNLPGELDDAPASGRLHTESGETNDWKWSAREMPAIESGDIEGKRYIKRKITVPQRLPPGYHKFVLTVKSRTCESMIISAPVRAYAGEPGEREWGVFLPLYALRREKGWGSGDYTGLGELADWVAETGGNITATLPLLPVFLDKPYEPSPYAPVSRLLWNEFYIDVTKIPELADCQPALAVAESAEFQEAIEKQQGKSRVDYRGVMSLKRQVMEKLCKCMAERQGSRLEEFRRFARRNPMVEEYARFRAVIERRGQTWHGWPQRLRDGDIRENDYAKDAGDYHLYAQWLAHEQMEKLSEKARGKGAKLYFDLPVGVHQDGYDVWSRKEIFAGEARLGAPPDAVFTEGQDWVFAPLHPERLRESRYGYVIGYLRHNLKYADMLRVDHVMGLHRLFWIPRGLGAGEGVYVRHNAEELYAILTLESNRSRSVIVGEDLGIVPSYVRPAMIKHGLKRMHILYYELADNDRLGRVARESIAGLNTHDMPTFAAFWEGADIPERKELGLTDEKGAKQESRARQRVKHALINSLREMRFLEKAEAGTKAVLRACLSFLSASTADAVLVNLEDLWLEKRSQNVPGTGEKYPSWQQKARYSLEDFCHMKGIRDILNEVNTLRNRGRPR